MNIIDLFAGAGGLGEGFRKSGYNLVAHVEANKAATKTLIVRNIYYFLKNAQKLEIYNKYLSNEITYEKLLESVPHDVYDSVLNTIIDESTLSSIFKKIDALNQKISGIIGGPPCQSYSLIGRKRNESRKVEDERIYLFHHYIKFIKRYQPEFFVFENVRGLLSFKDINSNKLFPQILDELKSNLGKDTYTIEYQLINSADFGVSQNRQRLIVIGIKNSVKNSSKVFDQLEKYRLTPLTLRELFNDLPYLSSGESNNNYLTNKEAAVENYYRKDDLVLTQHQSRKNNTRDLEIYKLAVEERSKGRSLKYNELPDHLINHKNIVGFLDRFKALSYDSLSHTVVAHISKDGHYYIHPDIKQNRSITPREAARIQSFPDSYYFEDSRTSAFVQIGNAVPPLLAEKIAKAIRDTMSY